MRDLKLILLWLLLPFNMLIGGIVTQDYNSNLVSIISLLLVAGALIWLIQNPNRRPYLGAYSIFLSLILLNKASLSYASGYGDVHFEYYQVEQTLQYGWNLNNAESNKAILLSLKSALPIFAKITGASTTTALNYIVAIVYAFTGPLLLLIYKRLLNPSAGLISVAVVAFASEFLFNPAIGGLSRQMFSVLFFLVLLYAMTIREQLTRTQWIGLSLVSAIAMVASYYVTAFLYLAILGGAFVTSIALAWILRKLPWRTNLTAEPVNSSVVVLGLIGIFTMEYFWRTNNIIYEQLSGLLVRVVTGFLSIGQSQTAQIATESARGITYSLQTMFFGVFLLLVTIGFFYLVGPAGPEFTLRLDYYTIAGIAFGLVGFTVVVPYLFFGIKRIFSITIPLFAPLFVAGIVGISYYLQRYVPHFEKESARRAGKSVMLLFLFSGLLLNSGLASELAHDYPRSPGLSQNSVQAESVNEQVKFYNHYQDFEQDVRLAKWMKDYTMFSDKGVYVDSLVNYPLISYGGAGHVGWFATGATLLPREEIDADSYIMLGYVNTQLGLYAQVQTDGPPIIYNQSVIEDDIRNSSKIYSSNASELYYTGDEDNE